jgi:hypothetical protein
MAFTGMNTDQDPEHVIPATVITTEHLAPPLRLLDLIRCTALGPLFKFIAMLAASTIMVVQTVMCLHHMDHHHTMDLPHPMALLYLTVLPLRYPIQSFLIGLSLLCQPHLHTILHPLPTDFAEV